MIYNNQSLVPKILVSFLFKFFKFVTVGKNKKNISLNPLKLFSSIVIKFIKPNLLSVIY